MNVLKQLQDYEKSSYKLIAQSFFLFLIIPGSYLFFLNFMGLNEEIIIQKFRNPNFFNINFKYVYYFETISKYLFIILPVNFLLILLINFYVGLDHKKVTSLYIPLYKITWPLIKISSLLIIIIFTFFITILFNNYFPSIPIRAWTIVPLGATALGCLIVFFTIIDIIKTFDKKNYMEIYGIKVSEKEQSDLFKMISNCSKKVKTEMPENIILGITDGFFVTSSDVIVFDKENAEVLKGKTLYIPLIYLEILTKDELTGVIGHELAHFSGEDTEYALKFNPMIFSLKKKFSSFDEGFSEAQKTENEDGLHGQISSFFMRFFLIMLLNPILYIAINLIKKDKKICINQELRADKIGASLCSNKKSLITGLCKFYIFSHIFNDLYNETNNKKKSLTKTFNKNLKNYMSNFDIKKDLKNIMEYEMVHPSDTHPKIKDRMKNIRIDIKQISKSDLERKNPSAAKLIRNYEYYDEFLSI
ncbi:M48 family metalloprotease [Candidatus Pelagibacter sp.]|nr:M48 family metalloprotease [Candidatus Pelagibacter sp.]